VLVFEIHVCQREHFPPHSNSGGHCRPSFFLLPSKTCLYFLIFGNAIIEGRSSLHGFFGRYIIEFRQMPKIRFINCMKKSNLGSNVESRVSDRFSEMAKKAMPINVREARCALAYDSLKLRNDCERPEIRVD